MIPPFLTESVLHSTADSLNKKFDKRFEKLDKKIKTTFTAMKNEVKIRSDIPKEIIYIPLWTRINQNIKEYMQKIKNFVLKIFKKA